MRRSISILVWCASFALALLVLFQWSIHYRDYDLLRFYSRNHLFAFSTFEGSLFIFIADHHAGGDKPPESVAAGWFYLPQHWYDLITDARKHGPNVPQSERVYFGFGYGLGQPSARMRQMQAAHQTVVNHVLAENEVARGQVRSAATRFAELQQRVIATQNEKQLQLPLWLLVLLFGLLPTIQTLRFIFRRRRFAKGLCPNCGYDLRATPDRCPECGTVIAIESVKETSS